MQRGLIFDDGEYDFEQSVFDELHEKLQQKIASSPEFQELVSKGIAKPIGAAQPAQQPAHADEDIPF